VHNTAVENASGRTILAFILRNIISAKQPLLYISTRRYSPEKNILIVMSFANYDDSDFRVYLQFSTCFCIELGILISKVLLQCTYPWLTQAPNGRVISHCFPKLAEIVLRTLHLCGRMSFQLLPFRSSKEILTTEIYQSLRNLRVPCVLCFFTIEHVKVKNVLQYVINQHP